VKGAQRDLSHAQPGLGRGEHGEDPPFPRRPALGPNRTHLRRCRRQWLVMLGPAKGRLGMAVVANIARIALQCVPTLPPATA
jgi:hypothetical protein